MTTGPASIHPRFSIQRHLGAGAFGEVYQVYDQERQMVVALKALREANPETIYRFKQEFRSLADVTHRNLVSLYELMSDGERWFFTMELVDGVNFLDYARGSSAAHLVDSLAQSPGLDPASLPTLLANRGVPQREADNTLDSGPISHPSLPLRVPSTPLAAPATMDLDRLLTSLSQLADGLVALHEADKLHCDIKPSNVLVTPEKRVVLLDFGLVTELSDPYELMQTMSVAGTPAYMSPEQTAGQPVAASDWYAVGVMLYQVLTGRLPFTGQLFDVLSNKQHLEPREPRELAADIPDDLNALCRDLLRRDPQARPSGADVLRRLDQARNQATVHRVALRPAQRTALLVGRESHLAELSKAYLATKQGRTAVVLVTGNSGMGKSALVRHFLTELPQRDSEVVVLVGRCYESESVPYKGLDMLVDALSRYLKRLPANEAEVLLPLEVMALARLFPVLRQVGVVAQARRRVLEIPDSQELRRRAFTALRELFARIAAQRPLVLFIDDLQWGDVDSGMLLAEILRPPDAPALLLIASYRDADTQSSPFLRTFLPSLPAALETHRLTVGELSSADAQQLANSLLAESRRLSPAQLDAITRESRGSPFFVHELTRYSGAAVLEPAAEPVAETNGAAPATLDEVIWTRVARLPERTRRLLEVVAVAGKPLPLAVARQATRLNGEEQQALTALRAGRLLRTRGTPANIELETYHDRVRETVIAHLAAADTSQHHRQLAQLLEAAGNADPETLTVHFAGAGDVARAASYAAAAAAQAAEALAFERAARLYQRALDLQTTPDGRTRLLRTRLADALTNAGRGAEAAHAYLAAVPGASAAESLDLQRRAAEQLLRSGHIDEGLAVVRTVLEAVGMKFPRTPQRALFSLVVHRLFASRRLQFHERAAAQVPNEELGRIDTCWSVAIGLVMVDAIRAADFQSRNLRFSFAAGEPVRIVKALALEAAYCSATGNRGRRRTAKLLERARGIAERVKHPDALGSAALAAGTAAWFHGEYQRCFDLMQRAETIYREQCLGVSWELCTAQHFSLRAQVLLGELPALQRRLPRLLQEAQERGDLYAVTNFRTRIEYWTHLCYDAAGRAREDLCEAIGRWSNQAFHSQHFYELVGQVEIALYEEDPVAAWRHLEPRWPAMAGSLILRNEPTRLEAWHVRARALLAAAAGSNAQRAAPLIEQASQDARRIARAKAGWSDPLAQLIDAGILAGRGNAEAALALLQSAEASFARFDMRLFEAVTRRRRGEVLGGDAGNELVAAADRWIAERLVLRPDRIAAMLAPGAWRGAGRGSV